MYKNHKTYTFTARNADDPDKVVTFTLDDERMRVNLTDLLDPAQPADSAASKPMQLLHQVRTKAKPVLLKVREKTLGPVHVSDVNARLSDDNFMIRMWPRLGGLRMAPVRIDMGQIDNEDAAEAFVNELEYRKEIERSPRKLFGPMDYWLGWAGLVLLAGVLIRRARYRQQSVG